MATTLIHLADQVVTILTYALTWLAMIGATLYAFNKFIPFNQPWHPYEGAITTAIKVAEKAVPSGRPDTAAQRLEEAMRHLVQAYRDQYGRRPSKKLLRQLREGVQLTHAQLERTGNLRPTSTNSYPDTPVNGDAPMRRIAAGQTIEG
jgi:hypothetical protein